MTVYGRLLLAGSGSLALLLGALAFQYLGGLQPCPMCIWQRWPHLVAAIVAVLAVTLLWRQHRTLAGIGVATMLVSFALGVWHAGVEWGVLPGLSTCSAPDPGTLSTEDLLAQIEATEPVTCGEVAWSFLGLSLAGWNALASLGLAGLWALAVRPQPQASSSASQ